MLTRHFKHLTLVILTILFLATGFLLFFPAVKVMENPPNGSFHLRFGSRQNMSVQDMRIEVFVPDTIRITTSFNFTRPDTYKLYIILPYLTTNVSVRFIHCTNKPIVNFINLSTSNDYGVSVINVTYVPSTNMQDEESIVVEARIRLGNMGVVSRSEMAKQTIAVPFFGIWPTTLSQEEQQVLGAYLSGWVEEFSFPEIDLTIFPPTDSTLLADSTFPSPIAWIASGSFYKSASWVIKASGSTQYIQTIICSYSSLYSQYRDFFIFLAGVFVTTGVTILIDEIRDPHLTERLGLEIIIVTILMFIVIAIIEQFIGLEPFRV